jgi:hypothetical protein
MDILVYNELNPSHLKKQYEGLPCISGTNHSPNFIEPIS